MDKKVVIIGGGAAGIMAAISATQSNKEVVLIEKNNEIGKKLKVTGGGRCNITNDSNIEYFIENIPTNGKFLYSGLNVFGNKELIKLLESNGCKVKYEEGGRVFPRSDKSEDIIELFLNLLKSNKVKIKLNSEVVDILVQDNKAYGVVLDNGSKIQCNSIIIATGGLSYPHLGSSGDGYKFAKETGHKITKIKPSLVPIIIKEEWIKDLMGISMNGIKVISKVGKRKIITEGDLLFTHYGISGPVVLEHSAFLNKHYKSGEHKLQLDILPNYSEEDINSFFEKQSIHNSNRTIRNILIQLIPKNLGDKLFKILEIDENIKLCNLTKKHKGKIITTLKNLNLTMVGFRPISEAIITSGGIFLGNINNKTMESKVIDGLYFAGEVLDIDGLTGGYNLQIAFTTGYVAGINA